MQFYKDGNKTYTIGNAMEGRVYKVSSIEGIEPTEYKEATVFLTKDNLAYTTNLKPIPWFKDTKVEWEISISHRGLTATVTLKACPIWEKNWRGVSPFKLTFQWLGLRWMLKNHPPFRIEVEKFNKPVWHN
jgi:hypothetical protein